MIKNGHPVTLYRESGIAPPEGKGWDDEYDGHRFGELSLENQILIKKWFFDNLDSAEKFRDKMLDMWELK